MPLKPAKHTRILDNFFDKSIDKLALIFLLIISVALSGCATAPKVVYVPTPVKCPIPYIPQTPVYPIKNLMPDDANSPDKVVKAYAASLKMCIGQNQAMRKQLEVYKGESS